MNQVYDAAIAACRAYTPEECREALENVIGAVGGLDFVRPGMRVGIKANLVSAARPDKAATTHPELLRQLTLMLREKGAEVVIGDSPGGVYNAAALNRVYAVSGMTLAEEAGAELNRDFSLKEADFPEARQAKSFTYTAWLDGCDAVIDFCKLKSHGMTALSAASKNLFGIIPGTMKPEYHFRFPDTEAFCDMLVDLNEWLKPVLSIADAVVAMEGNGPTAGTPRPLGAILASRSSHQLDLACASLIGLKREEVPTLEAAYRRGLVPASADTLRVWGELAAFRAEDFVIPARVDSRQFSALLKGPAAKFLERAAGTFLKTRPKVTKAECVGCGKCAGLCPAHAIEMKNALPRIDRTKCIRCFCCQEFCPKGAMLVSRSPVARLLVREARKPR